MRAVLNVLTVVAVPALLSAQSPLPVGSINFGPPSQIAVLDMGKLKGEPARLAWSTDGTQMYFQSIEGDYGKPKAIHHYVIDLSNGKTSTAQIEPEWFSPYWSTKSHKDSPDVPGLSIQLTTEQRKNTTTSTPMGGALARGGGSDPDAMGTSAGDATAAAYAAQTATVHSMKLKGETIGEFVNSVIVPGLTFGWGPKGTQVIAYSQVKGGKLHVMSADGKKQEVPGTKEALLPAWSQDGKKLAWLQRDGKKKFVLKVAEIR